MAIITISRGSYSKGKEIAELAAKQLGYECLSRELLLETSEQFNIPEVKLVRALHDAPSVLERFSYGKERYLSFLQTTFLQHALKDNIVYHGLAGHFMLKGIDHCLKVRILADIDDRVRLEMERENVSQSEALHILKKDDYERRKWTLTVWGKDIWDASLYDLIIHIHRIKVEDAVEIICHTAGLKHFRTTPESQKALQNLLTAARVKSTLVGEIANCQVSAEGGVVFVHVTAELTQEPVIVEEIKRLAQGVPGVEEIRVHVMPPGV
ncbi:MAG: cytidylate kinase-like family protein [Deltaproteobacteria bacterium]